MNAVPAIKSFLNKLNFLLGKKPKLQSYPQENINKFIPSPFKAVLIISCDFELAWGWRFAKSINCDLEKAKEIARNERKNIPIILDLCQRFNIPISWAIVGHLFLESCQRQKGFAHEDMPRLGRFENKYWKFCEGDWFDNDPCCDWKHAPEWYAPDLVEKIFNSRVKHEIACHSFSHIDCRDEVCPSETLKCELKKCKDAASKYGIKLESFVFPGNLIGRLEAIKEEGFFSYRTDKDVLGFPEKDEYGLWQIPTTAEISISSYGWDHEYYIRRYTTIIKRAIKYQRLCHFWFHPSENKEFLEKVLISLFEFISTKREQLYLTTMKDYAKILKNKN